MTTITFFTPVEKVTVTDNPDVTSTLDALQKAMSTGAPLALHTPSTSIYFGAETLKNTVVRVDR